MYELMVEFHFRKLFASNNHAKEIDCNEAFHEGHSMMSKVTAMGCTATGIVGAFLAVNSDPLEASFHAMKAMGIAGKRAASQSRGNGSMMINFLDELCNLVAGV